MQKQLAIKILIILVIGLAILIPVTMVKSKIYERQGYQEQVKYNVAQSWTGPQLLATPIVVIPYRIKTPIMSVPQSGFQTEVKTVVSDKISFILADEMTTAVTVMNDRIYKGIYQIPIYNSDIHISGTFSPQKIRDAIAKIKAISGVESVESPYISIHISDVRGLDKTPTLTFDGRNIPLHPGSRLAALPSGLFGDIPAPNTENEPINFTLDMPLRGMGSLSFTPLADNAKTTLSSNWPHPEFIGASLPIERTITASGFEASWSSTRYSNNSATLLKQCVETDNCYEFNNSSAGVDFIEPVNVYLQSERSIKYAMLFIGLSFITFFIFEHIKNVRIHPIQYTFVGLASAVFYLLLISLAEHIAFQWAYLIAVTCCSSLLLFYVRYMLKHLPSALLFFAMTASLYGLLYVIIQAEDFALLMGSLLVFFVLSTLMIITRKIDWYELSAPAIKKRSNEIKSQ